MEWSTIFNILIVESLKLGPNIIMGDLKADLLQSNVESGKSLRSSLKLADT